MTGFLGKAAGALTELGENSFTAVSEYGAKAWEARGQIASSLRNEALKQAPMAVLMGPGTWQQFHNLTHKGETDYNQYSSHALDVTHNNPEAAVGLMQSYEEDGQIPKGSTIRFANAHHLDLSQLGRSDDGGQGQYSTDHASNFGQVQQGPGAGQGQYASEAGSGYGHGHDNQSSPGSGDDSSPQGGRDGQYPSGPNAGTQAHDDGYRPAYDPSAGGSQGGGKQAGGHGNQNAQHGVGDYAPAHAEGHDTGQADWAQIHALAANDSVHL